MLFGKSNPKIIWHKYGDVPLSILAWRCLRCTKDFYRETFIFFIPLANSCFLFSL